MSLSEEQNHMQAQRNETERSLTEYPRRLLAGGQSQTYIVTSQMPFQLLLSLGNSEDAQSHASLTVHTPLVPGASPPGLLSLLPISQQPQWPQLSSYPSAAHDSSS